MTKLTKLSVKSLNIIGVLIILVAMTIGIMSGGMPKLTIALLMIGLLSLSFAQVKWIYYDSENDRLIQLGLIPDDK